MQMKNKTRMNKKSYIVNLHTRLMAMNQRKQQFNLLPLGVYFVLDIIRKTRNVSSLLIRSKRKTPTKHETHSLFCNSTKELSLLRSFCSLLFKKFIREVLTFQVGNTLELKRNLLN